MTTHPRGKLRALTQEEAITLHNSGEWRDWTDEEIVNVQLYQECLCVPFARFHAAVEAVLRRPVFTHELASTALITEYERRQTHGP